MKPADIERVFGRSRLRMVTGDHVEVYREAAQPGERRRYTKRFLATEAGDFRLWTEREWRILARLVGHGIGPVPDVVQFDRGAKGRPAIVQTYDAGVTVDHWATLLPVQRDGRVLRHVFEDCAHWWALARQCLIALDAIHELHLVHLDLKADNVCIPAWPPGFDPRADGQALFPRFQQLALIDFAFSLVWGESLTTALPIARQTDYHYQSPRLLQALEAGREGDLAPTCQLDWRCDFFSLAAMLRRYLPDPEAPLPDTWTAPRCAQARLLVRRLLETHDAPRPAQRPHAQLITMASQPLQDSDLSASLQLGWGLAESDAWIESDSPTPITRIAMPLAGRAGETVRQHAATARNDGRWGRVLWTSGIAAVTALSAAPLRDAWRSAAAPPTQAASAAAAVPADVASAPVVAQASPAQPASAAGAERSAPQAAAAPQAPPPSATGAPKQARVATSPPPRPLGSERRSEKRPANPPARAPAIVARRAAPPPRRDVVTAPAPVRPTTQPPARETPVAQARTQAPEPPAPRPPPQDDIATPAPRDLLARANELMATDVPRLAQRAERLVLRALFIAAQPEGADRDDDVRQAASRVRLAPPEPLAVISTQDARVMSEQARDIVARRGDSEAALGLLTRAFAADPVDIEIAGNLASLWLRQRPAQAEIARQLSLHALTLPHAAHPYGRIKDWTTFAVASALTGRERDARNAWLVTLALAPNVESQCRAAANAYAMHGEPVRRSVEDMLARLHSTGRSQRSPLCEWAPHWAGSGR